MSIPIIIPIYISIPILFQNHILCIQYKRIYRLFLDILHKYATHRPRIANDVHVILTNTIYRDLQRRFEEKSVASEREIQISGNHLP